MTERANKLSFEAKIPSTTELEGRFSFIEDATLRLNVAISFQYIIFLIALLDELEAENTTISSSIHKDMIVQTATIVESCTHHCLKKYIEAEKVKSSDVMPTDWETKDHKEIYKISEDERICGAIRYKKTEHLTDRTQSIVVNRAAQKAGILSETLFAKAEKLRELRNKIHLAGLQAVDGSYEKSDSQGAFDIATAVIENIEKKLAQLKT